MKVNSYSFGDAWIVDVEGSDGDERQARLLVDMHNDRLATFAADYSHLTTAEMSKRYGLSVATIHKYAKQLGLRKTVENRGGKNRKRVALINLDGFVVGSYNSIKEASKHLGISTETIGLYLSKKRKGMILPGATLVFK